MTVLKHGLYSCFSLKTFFVAEGENGEKEILKNINLHIDDGFSVITGPNGGGKSTLAKIIAGILKPTQGNILLDGEDISIAEACEYLFEVGLCARDYINLEVNASLSGGDRKNSRRTVN